MTTARAYYAALLSTPQGRATLRRLHEYRAERAETEEQRSLARRALTDLDAMEGKRNAPQA